MRQSGAAIRVNMAAGFVQFAGARKSVLLANAMMQRVLGTATKHELHLLSTLEAAQAPTPAQPPTKPAG